MQAGYYRTGKQRYQSIRDIQERINEGYIHHFLDEFRILAFLPFFQSVKARPDSALSNKLKRCTSGPFVYVYYCNTVSGRVFNLSIEDTEDLQI